MTSTAEDLSGGTKERILCAAERLFAERGFAGSSLRAVTSGAGVNLAAVHYHFGSKEGLLHAVLDRLVGPMNRERLARLDRLERSGSPSVEQLLEAFLAPALDPALVLDEQRLRSLVGRIYGEPAHLVGPLLEREFAEAGRRFLDAFARALPELPLEELRWRFQFLIGVLLHVVSGNAIVSSAVGGLPALDSSDRVLERMRVFLTAGMCAPSVAWERA